MSRCATRVSRGPSNKRRRDSLFIDGRAQLIPYTEEALFELLQAKYGLLGFDVKWVANRSTVELYVPAEDTGMWIGRNGKNASIMSRLFFRVETVKVLPYPD